MEILIRNIFSNSSEAMQHASEKKKILFEATLYGDDIEFENSLNDFNETFLSSINSFDNTLTDKKFLLLYAWMQLKTIITMENITEFEVLNVGIRYIYELEIQEDISQFRRLNNGYFDAYRKFYQSKKHDKEKTDFVRNCEEYINEHIYDKVDLEDLAKSLKYSTYYLSKRFKKETGVTISQYVTYKKINRARTLLDQDYSVKSISEQLGYESQSYFAECFKAVLGISPTQYRFIIKKQ